MYKAYKFRLMPNNKQKILISKTFGTSRFIYNYFLDKCKNNNFTSAFDMIKELPNLYKEYSWLKEVIIQHLKVNLVVKHIELIV